jgi:ABC-2 type transport system ATP-binding protein
MALRRSRALASAAVGCLVASIVVIGAAQARASEVAVLPGGPTSISDPAPVQLDTALFLPDQTPAPAVLLAHGFGGSKESLTNQAEELADRGFVVLTYSARGFGTSTGDISVNSPDFEIADAIALIDYLGTRDDVEQDAAGDPRVGVAGGSYGGALALLAGGYDPRVDAIAADITWNDLETSLFGQSAIRDPEPRGAFKKLWTGWFFSVGLVDPGQGVTECGRFSPDWCRAYIDATAYGELTPASSALMRASSPATVTSNITAPTLLAAGEADSLFPIAQANATAEQIRAAHPQTPVKMVWHGGGHDGGINESERVQGLMADWFETYLVGPAGGSASATTIAFEATLAGGAISTEDSSSDPVVLQSATYPGIRGSRQLDVALAGPPQRILAPSGGTPAAITVLPGLGGSLGSLLSVPLPGQAAAFESQALAEPLTIVGASTVTLSIASTEPVEDVTLFASLRIVSASGRESFPQGLVAPIRLDRLDASPVSLSFELPAIVAAAAAGDRLRLVLSTTDSAYLLPNRPALYDIALAGATPGTATLSVPLADMQPVQSGVAAYWWLLGTLPIIGLIIGLLAWKRPRSARDGERADLIDVPLAIEGLGKVYKGGFRAVDEVSFTVPQGVVLGLLGPNGAGKTTTMRMMMGLIRPTEGELFVYGQRVDAGSPVLSRVGALVEGAGFLPHLSGRENLDLYWRAAGRGDEESYLDEVLAIADLGTAIDRKVRSYSQGMRQRLGIAQAMLGKPDLLVLDEPTNGLDPPQIRAMRDVLHEYVEGGRTVIISSHMLSEVEQTCTDVVVMHRGRLVATGTVADLLRGRTGQRLEDVFLEIVGTDLTVGQS